MDLYFYYLHNNRIDFQSNFERLRSELQARQRNQQPFACDTDSEGEADDPVDTASINTQSQGWNRKHSHQPPSTDSMAEVESFIMGDDDIFTTQHKLKEDAKMAFAFGAKMARMQVELERRMLAKKNSSLYDIIGLHTQRNQALTVGLLEDLDIGQLQVIVNDLYYQIEANNEELVSLLIERDSLSMEQDSILVDIDDLTKRLQERALNLSKPSKGTSSYVYVVKRPVANAKKTSLFQHFLRKAMFI